MTQGFFTGMLRVLGVFALVTGTVWGDTSMTSERDAVIFSKETVARLKTEIDPLNLRIPPVHTPLLRLYFKYYEMPSHAGDHYFGFIQSKKYRIATHLIRPAGAQATVLILHGYFDHSGIMKHLIRNCLKRQLAVVCFDLPGHGLSSGVTANIDDFSEYAEVLDDVIRFCRPFIPGTISAVGHSAGSAVLFEYLYQHQGEANLPARVIMVAPLVRHAYWYVSKAHYYLAKPFLHAYPRPFRTNSSDPQFLAALRNDPLEGNEIPLTWLGALYAWNRKIEDYERFAAQVMVIQGTADAVVDWEFNLNFLKAKLPMVEVITIDGGRHHLLNESKGLRNKVMKAIDHFILARPKLSSTPKPSKAHRPGKRY